MKLKTIITLSTAALALTVVSLIGANSFLSSYNAWKETYDTVMEEKELNKLENINGVYVTKVTVEHIGYKPCYVIYGKYDETVDTDTLSFKLYTYQERANFAEIVKKEIHEENKSFRMYTDISMCSADGEGNPIYNNDSASQTLPDQISMHAYYPKLVIGDVEKDLVNTKLSWDGDVLEFNDCTYTIQHNNSQDTFPFAMPVLLKTTEQVIPEDATYAATGVELVQYDNDVTFIIRGTSSGYNRETLSKVIAFDMRCANGTSINWGIRGTQGGPVTMEEDGEFALYVRLNNVPTCGKNPYYTRFGDILNQKGDISDMIVPGLNGTVDQTTIIESGRKYIAYIGHGTGATNGYNTTGVYITEA